MKEEIIDALFEGTMDGVCKGVVNGRDEGIVDRVNERDADVLVIDDGLKERTVDVRALSGLHLLKNRSTE